MQTSCCDSPSSKKDKRYLVYCDSAGRSSDDSSAIATFESKSKKARVTADFDCEHLVSPLLSTFHVASTEIAVNESQSLAMDEQYWKKIDQTPKQNNDLESTRLVERTCTASGDNKTEIQAASNIVPSAVTPFSSMVDIKQVTGGGKIESTVSTSTSDQDSGFEMSRMVSKQLDDSPSTTTVQTLPEKVFASVTPFPSTVDLKETVDITSKVEAICDLPSPNGVLSATCFDSSNVSASATETAHDDKPEKIIQKKYGFWSAFKFALLSLFVVFVYTQSDSRPVRTSSKDTVYVPGAGFSGFWYTLGKLRSLSDPLQKDFYCYSSGCLAVVTILRNLTVNQVYDMARFVQVRWQEGDLHRYEVVPAFLDDLLGDIVMAEPTQNATVFDPVPLLSLNIITSVHRGGPMLASEIRRADSLQSLKTMLLQTTWIPFAVGGSLWHNDHLDGAFTAGQHPLCALEVGLPWNFDMIMNAVNINLGKDKVELFYKMGLEDGF